MIGVSACLFEFQDPQMQVVGRIRSSYALQVHKVTSTKGEGFLFKKSSSMCTNLVLIHRFSVTSRRGLLTSRRQLYMPLSRRDVNFYISLPRRDVDPHVATSTFTFSATSRREFLQASVTSRRCPSRRDVGCHPLCDVATSPRTSRRCPVLNPRPVHFGSSPRPLHCLKP